MTIVRNCLQFANVTIPPTIITSCCLGIILCCFSITLNLIKFTISSFYHSNCLVITIGSISPYLIPKFPSKFCFKPLS